MNFLWSIVFFRFQAFWAAVAVIVVLDLLIVATMLEDAPRSEGGGLPDASVPDLDLICHLSRRRCGGFKLTSNKERSMALLVACYTCL